MPKWIHDRAEHILASNPDMEKDKAFAIATQQAHSKGKTPKDYGTSKGKKQAKRKYDTPKDDTASANPGDKESPKMGMPMGLFGLHLFTKEAFTGDDDPSLLEQVGKKKVRKQKSVSPDPKFQVKQAMIPASPYTAPGNPQTKLTKSQKIGTPDDPNMDIKPLNKLKPPEPTAAEGSSSVNRSSQLKFGSVQEVAQDFFKKLAFSPAGALSAVGGGARGLGETQGMSTGARVGGTAGGAAGGYAGMHLGSLLGKGAGTMLGGDLGGNIGSAVGGIGGAYYGSGIGSEMGVNIAGNQRDRAVMQHKLGQALVKTAWGATGFGGTGGHWRPRYASGQGRTPVPSLGVLDPHLKQGGNVVTKPKKAAMVKEGFNSSGFGGTATPKEWAKKAVALTPKGRLASARKEGKPKMTGFAGPSVADVSKPVGFGEPMPGATKNRI
jgi:hypothetical protein